MSSYSDNHQPSSSQFLPPQSAQVRSSLFGGPSSDVDPPPSSLPELPRRSIFGGSSSQDVAQEPEKQPEPIHQGVSDQEEDELDMILRERPLEAYYGSDGDSFRESSDDEGKKASKMASTMIQKSETGVPQPIYVLHRGVDLPPGVQRPNRWTGYPSTYRKLIMPERNVLNSLMTTRARDLAGHLYDIFVTRQQPNKEEIECGDPEDSDDEEAKAFRKKWVAWPMSAASVPRADEPIRRRLDGLDTYRMQPDTRPSAELEGWIMATMIKSAKERFLAREWDDEDIDISKKEEPPDPDAMVMDMDEENEESKLNIPQQPFREPVVRTDDDISHHQLRPLSRTVISQLDQLLIGLHHALKHRARDQYSSDESATDTEDEESPPPAKRKDKKRDGSRGRKHNREDEQSERSSPDRSSRSRSYSESEAGVEAHDTLEHSQVVDDTDQEYEDIMERLPLRDWSEVMGIASIKGLPPDAIKRASKRCADIFDQDMTFRTFRQGRMMKVRRLRGGRDLYEYAYGESETESDSGPRRRARRKARINEKMGTKRLPRDSSKEPERALPKKSRSPSTAEPTPPATSQPRFGKDPNKDSKFFCPVEGCRRSTDGFNRRWNYKLHMKKMHPEQYDKTFS